MPDYWSGTLKIGKINKLFWWFYKRKSFILVFLSEVWYLKILHQGARGDWDFRISDLVKAPDGTDI